MHSVLYTPESEENLVNIFSYIAQDNSFYAAKVLSNIKRTIDILKLFPNSGHPVDEYSKMIVDSKYKFKIVYKIKGDIIYIISISKYQNTWK